MQTIELIKRPFNYENKTLCSLCKGACCKTLPGQYAPQDFKDPITYEFIKKLLLEGKTAIDWMEGDTCYYYLRPKTVKGGMIDPSWGGQCINLTDKGCSLDANAMPLQCRMLKPLGKIGSLKCKIDSKFKKGNMAAMWKDYQSVLFQLVNELR